MLKITTYDIGIVRISGQDMKKYISISH